MEMLPFFCDAAKRASVYAEAKGSRGGHNRGIATVDRDTPP